MLNLTQYYYTIIITRRGRGRAPYRLVKGKGQAFTAEN